MKARVQELEAKVNLLEGNGRQPGDSPPSQPSSRLSPRAPEATINDTIHFTDGMTTNAARPPLSLTNSTLYRSRHPSNEYDQAPAPLHGVLSSKSPSSTHSSGQTTPMNRVSQPFLDHPPQPPPSQMLGPGMSSTTNAPTGMQQFDGSGGVRMEQLSLSTSSGSAHFVPDYFGCKSLPVTSLINLR